MKTDDVRFAALGIIVALADGEELHRRTIANRVFGTDLVGAGATYAACRYLVSRGWADQCPYHPLCYRPTAAGRDQYEKQGALRDVIEGAA